MIHERRPGFRGLLILALGLALWSGCATQRPGSSVVSAPASPPAAIAAPAPSTAESAPPPACPLCVDPTSPKVLAAYAAAVAAAKYPEPAKISRDLAPLVGSNTKLQKNAEGRLLMVTWTNAGYFPPDKFPPGKTFPLHGDTWLTAVPEVQDFCQALGLDGAMLTLRLEQRFGLPPDNGKDAFLQIWVDPTDIFRPCPDPETADHECQVEIPVVDRNDQRPWDCTLKRQISGSFVTVHPGHLKWMCDNWDTTYGNKDPLKNYPWTALGYTYDWGNPDDPRGSSEYVAPKGSDVVFESLERTEAYCTN